ncbi:hypothetical protein NQ315_012932 [Exocentrus adspersus]|uniref:Uncharacterized protein n=1 Tax=Exocentrus adspersus TaxID=1586481 RepID=A0AAV8VSA6_9CUCU|nr:hypothetical protein NQ315_012932 [Exocentrus adspersus]
MKIQYGVHKKNKSCACYVENQTLVMKTGNIANQRLVFAEGSLDASKGSIDEKALAEDISDFLLNSVKVSQEEDLPSYILRVT